MRQTLNVLALMFSGFVVGYIVGLNPKPQAAQASPIETVAIRVTGFCPCEKCCPGTSDGITANGHKIKLGERFVAADKSLPFGTRVAIPGYNGGRPVLVLDRGGAIKGNRLDCFFPTHGEALIWGVKHLQIRIERK